MIMLCSSLRSCCVLLYDHVVFFLKIMLCSSLRSYGVLPYDHIVFFLMIILCSFLRLCCVLLYDHVFFFMIMLCSYNHVVFFSQCSRSNGEDQADGSIESTEQGDH